MTLLFGDDNRLDDPNDEPARFDTSYAGVVERLLRDYETDLDIGTVVSVVQECRAELQGEPVGAMPELTERLARIRLSQLLDSQLLDG
jgi:hypothetical protein